MTDVFCIFLNARPSARRFVSWRASDLVDTGRIKHICFASLVSVAMV